MLRWHPLPGSSDVNGWLCAKRKWSAKKLPQDTLLMRTKVTSSMLLARILHLQKTTIPAGREGCLMAMLEVTRAYGISLGPDHSSQLVSWNPFKRDKLKQLGRDQGGACHLILGINMHTQKMHTFLRVERDAWKQYLMHDDEVEGEALAGAINVLFMEKL